MNIFDSLFFTGSIFYSLIAGCILMFRKRDQVFTSRLLGYILLALGWYALLYVLVITRLLIDFPYTYRIFSPLYYLIPPFSFFYVRATLNGETKFRKNDWPHFILAVLNFIDLLPFYFSSAAHKQELAEAVANNIQMSYQVSSGLVPDVIHFIVRPIQGIIYMIFVWRLVYLTRNREREKTVYIHGRDWLFIFTLMMTLIYAGMFYVTASGFHYSDQQTRIVIMAQCAAFFFISLHLFLKPELLYGIQVVKTVNVLQESALRDEALAALEIKPKPKVINKKLSPEYIRISVEKLELYMLTTGRYRQKGIAVHELASELDINSTNLSFIINRHYGQRFTDFINTCRVNYVIERFKLDDWKDHTLEALANDAGFTSRSAFYDAFRKVTSLNPSEYLAKLNLSENPLVSRQ